MTGWVITACVVIVTFLLLLAPVSLRFVYRDGKFQLHLCWLLLKFDFSPETLSTRASRRAQKVKHKVKKLKKAKVKKIKEKKKRMGSIPALKSILKYSNLILAASRKSFDRIRRNLVFYKVDVKGCIAAKDAHKTAMMYSYAAAVTATLLSVISRLFVLRRYRVQLMPDFTRDSSLLDISVRVRIMPIVVLSAALGMGWSVLRIIRQLNHDVKQSEDIKQSKGGKIHEPAASH